MPIHFWNLNWYNHIYERLFGTILYIFPSSCTTKYRYPVKTDQVRYYFKVFRKNHIPKFLIGVGNFIDHGPSRSPVLFWFNLRWSSSIVDFTYEHIVFIFFTYVFTRYNIGSVGPTIYFQINSAELYFPLPSKSKISQIRWIVSNAVRIEFVIRKVILPYPYSIHY